MAETENPNQGYVPPKSAKEWFTRLVAYPLKALGTGAAIGLLAVTFLPDKWQNEGKFLPKGLNPKQINSLATGGFYAAVGAVVGGIMGLITLLAKWSKPSANDEVPKEIHSEQPNLQNPAFQRNIDVLTEQKSNSFVEQREQEKSAPAASPSSPSR